MNAHRALRVQRIELLMIALLLLTAGALVALASVVLPLIHMPTVPTPVQRDPVQLVSSFHQAVNDHAVDAMLGLFAEGATISDRGAVYRGRDEIRRWAEDLQRTGGSPLRMINIQAGGAKIYWHDMVDKGPKPGAYILAWEAVMQKGRIISLTVSSLPTLDRK